MVFTNANYQTGQPFQDIRTLATTPDGNFIAFIANGTGFNTLIYLRNMQAGTNILVSVNQTGGVPTTATSDAPTVDPTGRYVAFTFSGTSPLTANSVLSAFASQLYLRDVQAGQTAMIGLSTNGVGVGAPYGYVMSDNAQFFSFDSANSGLVPNDNNRSVDVFVEDIVAATNGLISVSDPNQPVPAPNGYSMLFSTSVSTNGRYIAFASDADNLVANDTNGCRDVFVRDTLLQTNILVSVGMDGFAGRNSQFSNLAISSQPSISGDGRYVAFTSWATDLLAGDNNNNGDVFLRDLQAGTTSLVSTGRTGGFGNGTSFTPVLSTDGRFVMYQSLAQNLTTNSFQTVFSPINGYLFLRDILLKTNYAMTTGAVVSASMTLDGRHLAFIGAAPGSGSGANNLYVWDSLAVNRIYTNTSSGLANVAISPDGQWIAYVSSIGLSAYNLASKTSYAISAGPFDLHESLQFSADDRFLLFVTKRKVVSADTNGTYDVYLHDFQTGPSGTNLLISQGFEGTNAARGISYQAVLSPDGRYVAYVSSAPDIVPGEADSSENVYIYDRINAATILVSLNLAGSSAAKGFSMQPVFSGDSSNLVFVSSAPNLSGAGFNLSKAIFVLNLSDQSVIGSGGGTNSFDVQFLGSSVSGQGPTLAWPVTTGVAPGGSYRVEYKDDLNDPIWHDLNGNTTIVGTQGRATDLAPSTQRFYRIVLTY